MRRSRALPLAFALSIAACAPRTPDPELRRHELFGALAPDFTVNTVDGDRVSLSALRGHVVVVSFWASWSSPSEALLTKLDQLAAKYKSRGVDVIGISVDDDASPIFSGYGADRSLVAELARAYGAGFPIAWDPKREVTRRWLVRALPTEFVVDGAGIVRAAFAGYADGVDVAIERDVLASLQLSSESRQLKRD